MLSAAYIYNKVKVALEQDKLFLRPELSLIYLSRVVGTNTVYLSQAINLLAGCNFKTLVNRYRIEHVCQEAEKTNRDVEDIAHDYSFWSRSTLYDVFKTHTGLTPRQYMASMAERHEATADTPKTDKENKG